MYRKNDIVYMRVWFLRPVKVVIPLFFRKRGHFLTIVLPSRTLGVRDAKHPAMHEWSHLKWPVLQMRNLSSCNE
jgi:hypothetical protein